ncbi:MAG: redox-regulated ATPase YchF [Patescibacteria group bacterium]
MSLSVGIVGLPNVGKSTLFNALLKKQQALAANYPFATIEPNIGIAEVPDERLPILAKLVNTSVIKPAVVEFVDIAGLVRGASKGEGLGNQFLSHIRETDAICHVLRNFSDESILREGAISPDEDLATIRTELQLADLSTLEKQVPPKGSTDKSAKERWEVVCGFKSRVENGQNAIDWSTSESGELEQLVARELGLLTAKKELVVINVDESELQNQQAIISMWSGKLQIKPEQIVVISARIESELSSLADEDQKIYLADLGIACSGLERLAKIAYQTLNLQSFLTAGEKEVRAWTIGRGLTAPEAAGVIHSDFCKNFIKAKVANYDDFIKYQGWSKLKEVGKVRLEGKDYMMQEGDIVEFMIGK